MQSFDQLLIKILRKSHTTPEVLITKRWFVESELRFGAPIYCGFETHIEAQWHKQGFWNC